MWYGVPMAVIKRSTGVNRSETILGDWCDRVFLKAWNYLNPHRAKGRELCDLLAIFDGHIFIFQVKEIKFSEEEFDSDAEINTVWERWKRKAFTAQLESLEGAKNWILNYPDRIYLDAACKQPLPIKIGSGGYKIHKILVAHGAAEACKNYSDENIAGSLGVCYGNPDKKFPLPTPFMLPMDKNDPVHVLNEHNLPIVLGELNTAWDFTQYLETKEYAIQKFTVTTYCGEEDMLAAYISKHPMLTKIPHGLDDKKPSFLFIQEGEWEELRVQPEYKHKKTADEISCWWDKLLQMMCELALEGSARGNDNLFNGLSAIYEMAKEPRAARGPLAEAVRSTFQKQKNSPGGHRYLARCKSHYETTAYVLLWEDRPANSNMNDVEFSKWRQVLLDIACGAAKNAYPQYTKIVGFSYGFAEAGKGKIALGDFFLQDCEFALLNCETWTEEQKSESEEMNKEFGFFTKGA